MRNLLAVALLLVFGSIVLPQSPMSAQDEKAVPVGQPMWTYEEVSLRDIPDKAEMLKVLNERGREGWELVGILPRGSFDPGARDQFPALVLKRGRR
jgi:hypothetical protein